MLLKSAPLAPADAAILIAAEEDVAPALSDHWQDVCAAFHDADAHDLYVRPEEIAAALDARASVRLSSMSADQPIELRAQAPDLAARSLKEAEPFAAALAADSHELTILPFISGERSLGWHSEARLTITGISRDSSPAAILRAGYESLAYRLLALHERLCDTLQNEADQHKLQASGGVLLGSSLMKSILADMLSIPIYPSQEHEASARGAALLALEALEVLPDLALVAPMLLEPMLPDGARGETYRRAAGRQQRLYQALLEE